VVGHSVELLGSRSNDAECRYIIQYFPFNNAYSLNVCTIPQGTSEFFYLPATISLAIIHVIPFSICEFIMLLKYLLLLALRF
jgi:hypothetical protein